MPGRDLPQRTGRGARHDRHDSYQETERLAAWSLARPPDAGGIGLHVHVRMKRVLAAQSTDTCSCCSVHLGDRVGKGKGRAEVQGPFGRPCNLQGEVRAVQGLFGTPKSDPMSPTRLRSTMAADGGSGVLSIQSPVLSDLR
jgi:hypothetical protein